MLKSVVDQFHVFLELVTIELIISDTVSVLKVVFNKIIWRVCDSFLYLVCFAQQRSQLHSNIACYLLYFIVLKVMQS